MAACTRGSRGARRAPRCLIAVSDDATKRVLHAPLYPSETTVGDDDGAARRCSATDGLRWRSTPTARTGRFTRRRPKGPSTRRSSPRSGGRWSALGHRAHSRLLAAGARPQRTAESHVSGSPGQRAAGRGDHDRWLAANALSRRALRAASTTPRSAAPRATRRVRSCRSARSISSRSSVTKRARGRARQHRELVGRRRCSSSRRSPAGARAPACAVTVRRHLDRASTRSGAGRGASRTIRPIARARDGRTAMPPVEAAGAVDAKNAPTAPWKTPRTRFPQLPQAVTSR